MTMVPQTAHDFLEGEVYAFLIDVFDGQGRVQMRIYYNDSASTEPIGFPPPALTAPNPIPTVAVLTAPGHKWEQGYPDRILNHSGVDYALIGHWEYFLGEWGGWQGGTPTTDVKGFVRDMERLMAGKFWVPTIGTAFVFNP